MTTQDLIDFYKGLLIIQYSSGSNALGEINTLIGELVQNQIISQVRDAFDIDSAIGKQLDILASYRGLSRILFGVLAGDFWSLVPYSDLHPGSYFGWGLYSGATPGWRFMQYNDLNALAYTLTDSQLRRLIKLKAATDAWDGTLGSLDTILYSFFTTYVNLLDDGNRTIIYQHKGLIDPDTDKLFSIAVLAGALPHPAGIAVSFAEV